MNGGTDASRAAILFEGADVGLDQPNENINAFTMFGSTPSNAPPTDLTPDSFAINESIWTTGGVSLGILSTIDPDSGDSFTYSILPGTDSSGILDRRCW